MNDQPIPTWRVGDQAELANGDERTVHREQLAPIPDFHGNGATREVRLARVRLDPAESLAVARHSPNGFNWGYGGSGPAQLALTVLLQVTNRETALAHYQAFKWNVIASLPNGDFTLSVDTARDGLASRTDV